MWYLKKLVSEFAFRFFYNEILNSKVIGLGTGSTVRYLINLLIENNIINNKVVVVSSSDTRLILEKYGINSYTPIDFSGEVDLYIDGFDEASYNLDLVKGRGGAFNWEKLIAEKARIRIYIADYTKWNNKPYLYLKPVPVEVCKEKIMKVYNILDKMGLKPIIRMSRSRDGPVITDSNNYIIDIKPGIIYYPEKLDKMLHAIEGVVSTGIFPSKLVDYVIIAGPSENIIKIYSVGRASY